MAAAQWFYAVGADRNGPVGEDELKSLVSSGVVTPANLIWREGMANWTALGEVPEFMVASPPTSPVAPPPPGAAPVATPQPAMIAPRQAGHSPGRIFTSEYQNAAFEGELWLKIIAWVGVGLLLLGSLLAPIAIMTDAFLAILVATIFSSLFQKNWALYLFAIPGTTLLLHFLTFLTSKSSEFVASEVKNGVYVAVVGAVALIVPAILLAFGVGKKK